MKKIISILLALLLILSMAIPAYACTEDIPERPQLSGWCGWLDWYRQWFPWIPDRECPDATQPTEPTEPTEPEMILAAPVITEAGYYHQGTMSRLQIQWEDVEGAEYYEVLITRADGETITYNPIDNLIFDKAAECPRVYIEAERLWASASVQIRAVAGDVYSEWSEAEKIGCDMLHNF